MMKFKFENELDQIRIKDLTSLSESELKQYREYLVDLKQNTGKRVFGTTINMLFTLAVPVLTALIILFEIIAFVFLRTQFNYTVFSVFQVLVFICVIGLRVFNIFKKRYAKLIQETKNVCGLRIGEIDNNLAIMSVKNELAQTTNSADNTANTAKTDIDSSSENSAKTDK